MMKQRNAVSGVACGVHQQLKTPLRALYSSLLRELFRLRALPAPWHVLLETTFAKSVRDGRAR